jgi:hypothetical protein
MRCITAKRAVATTLSAAAIAGTIGAPPSLAMPADPVGAPGQPGDTQIVAPTPRSNAAGETTSNPGFDLSSAAIGAAGGTGLLIVVVAAGGLAWRRPITRDHGAASA